MKKTPRNILTLIWYNDRYAAIMIRYFPIKSLPSNEFRDATATKESNQQYIELNKAHFKSLVSKGIRKLTLN